LTKEMDKRYMKLANKNQITIDSLERGLLTLKNNRSNLNASVFSARVNQILAMQNKIKENNNQIREELESQIWKQLNEYIDQYGAYKQLDIVMGNIGNGSLLYNRRELDVTEEMIVFVNKKYKGFN